MGVRLSLGKFIPATAGPAEDATRPVLEALRRCKGSEGAVLELPKGTYHFYQDHAFEEYYFVTNNDHGLKRIAFPLIGYDGLTVEGNGSELIFHGRIMPFVVDGSKNITIRNLSIDYAIPFYAEGEILRSGKDVLELKIDKTKHPYHIFRRSAVFEGEGWEGGPIEDFLEYDSVTRAPAYRAGDDWAERGTLDAEEIADGVIRFTGSFQRTHRVGNTMVLSIEGRNCPGFFLTGSENVTLAGIEVYHVGAMGLVAQDTKDISLDRFNVRPREGSGRILSANADATHFVNCTGTVKVENCVFLNQKDDALNCHGIYTTVSAKAGEALLEVELQHCQQAGVNIYHKGDRIRFVGRKSMQPFASAVVKSAGFVNQKFMLLELTGAIPAEVAVGDAIENDTRMPKLIVRGCVSGKNRARGFLISTPKEAVFENNTVSSPGSAVLVEGDANFWFESGPVGDLLIRNNRFENCLASPWGIAVIQVTPGGRRVCDEYPRCYHRNIRVESNRFLAFDKSLVYACSVDGFSFCGNTVEQTAAFPPYIEAEAMIDGSGCQNVRVTGNQITGFAGETLVSRQLEESGAVVEGNERD